MSQDFIKLWAVAKQKMGQSLGVYRMQDGTVATIKGLALPLWTLGQAQAMMNFWQEVGNALGKDLRGAGRTSESLQLAQKSLDFATGYAGWYLDTSDKYGAQRFKGKYLFMPAAFELNKLITGYVIWLSTIDWSAKNIESAYERGKWALDNTTGGSILKPFFISGYHLGKTIYHLPDYVEKSAGYLKELAKDTVETGALLWTITKWGTLGVIGYFIYRKIQERRG